jgi:hypothetical protein
VRAATDVVVRTSRIGGPGYRVGGEVAWQERYQGRVGYVISGPTGRARRSGRGFPPASCRSTLHKCSATLGRYRGVRPRISLPGTFLMRLSRCRCLAVRCALPCLWVGRVLVRRSARRG